MLDLMFILFGDEYFNKCFLKYFLFKCFLKYFLFDFLGIEWLGSFKIFICDCIFVYFNVLWDIW